MKYAHFIIIFLLIPYHHGCKAENHFTLLDIKNNIIPIVVIPNKPNPNEERSLLRLIEAFEKTTNKKLFVKNESALNAIDLQKNIIYYGATKAFSKTIHPTINSEGFYIYQKDKAVYISSQNSLKNGIWTALNYFIEHYLDGLTPDEGATLYAKKNNVIIPSNLAINEEPAFEFRQAFFPSSTLLYYGTHNFENEWICWGHNLGKFLTKYNPQPLSKDAYAFINGQRNDEQFCFSSDELFNQIVKAINHRDADKRGLKFSVAPNDNSLICGCEKCQAINGGIKTASNSVCFLLNKLATKFPEVTFTTLAYVTTLKAPTNTTLKSNTAVLLSTIDIPKGIPIEKQKQFAAFDKTLKSWQQVCAQIYVWDYPIQYTNYFDVFPNLNALQSDMQYFKKSGVRGVFSQGSEENYGLFCEWKCFAISKLLWNPKEDLNLVRTNFFNKFYGNAGQKIESFYANCENNLATRKATLDIYGNVELAHKAYLDYDQLQQLLTYLRKENAQETGKDPRQYYNVHKISTCLEILSLQYNRWKGIHENGYATPNDNISWTIKPTVKERIVKLKKSTLDNEIEFMNENRDLVKDYLTNFETFLVQTNTKNLIWNLPIMFNSSFDDSYPANGAKTLNDGLNGTGDYSFNWLLFNKTNLDVTISNLSIEGANKLSLQFLHDPQHYIFTPTSIQLFAGNSTTDLKLVQTISPSLSQKTVATIVPFKFEISKSIAQAKVIRIVATNLNQLPSWKYHPTKKPTIACDEINIQ